MINAGSFSSQNNIVDGIPHKNEGIFVISIAYQTLIDVEKKISKDK